MNGFKDFITQYRGAIIGVIIAILILVTRFNISYCCASIRSFYWKLCTTK